LKAGDTVVDIACGTGANFSFLQEKIGSNGRIVGVDFTDAMLTKAQERVTENHWRNVCAAMRQRTSFQTQSTV
jgi:ubiquinone/menaquinone biosynthesis C-methylase UbiE